jgi:Zn-dependent peptidase ImmA (M78 family)
MHQGTLREKREEEADSFAAEFLMPARQVVPYLDNLTLPKLATLKIQWKVSMAAILKRAQTLKTITPYEAKKLWMQMSRYRMREPEELDIPIEIPYLFREIVDVYQNELQYDIKELSKMLHLSEEDTYRFFLEPSKEEVAKAAIEEAERLLKGDN